MHLAWRTLMVAAWIPALAPAIAYADCRAHSPDHSTALIELYTSEGCDSCPPADRWLSSLSKQKLGDRAVALALHVDYWDRLGWKDRFGSAGFSQRQREESARSGGEFVYTPQVMLQGRDFPQWQAGAAFDRAIASTPSLHWRWCRAGSRATSRRAKTPASDCITITWSGSGVGRLRWMHQARVRAD